jgi:hypothetical protein
MKPHLILTVALGAAAIQLAAPRPSAKAAFDVKTAGFSVSVDGHAAAYEDMPAFVLPGGYVSVEVVDGAAGEYSMEADEGLLARSGPRQWKWQAPAAPGDYELELTGPSGSAGARDEITIHAFVMVPAREQRRGFLNGYRMGEYPSTPLKGNPVYKPPAGFVEVTRENEDTRVTPHFRLKQFVCKQEPISQYPKYIVLQPSLLLHLEGILRLVNEQGFDVDTLHVMSGYRTPYYNKLLRDAVYSMHQFGGAADIFVDKDDRFRMDDLNGDRRVDTGDAKYLAAHIEQLLARPAFRKFEGGMGIYPATSAHPPFVHVDVRGTRARW